MVLSAALAALLSLSVAEPGSAAVRRDAAPVATVRVSSFNVLGSSHTPAGGSRAPGTTRIVWAGELLARHHVDVVGFQELQADQRATFLTTTAGAWALYPGSSLRSRDGENSIGWRTAKFDLVQATTVTIPYFDGNPRPMPVVLLRERTTGLLTWFSNFHNPATTRAYPAQGRWRARATAIEVALQDQLRGTGIPSVMTGDMNERAPYFCAVQRPGSAMRAARGGYWSDGVCHALRPRAIDWIFGSRRLGLSGYTEDRSALVARTTDHPVLAATVTVDGATFPAAGSAVAPAPFVPAVSYTR